MKNQETEKIKINWWLAGAYGAGVLVVIIIALWAWLMFGFNERFLPGISIGGLDIGGRNIEAVKADLEKIKNELNNGIVITCSQGQATMKPSAVNSFGVMEEYYFVDWDATWNNLTALGSRGSWLTRSLESFRAVWSGKDFNFVIKQNDEQVEKFIKGLCGLAEKPVLDAGLNKVGKDWETTPESNGLKLDYQGAIKEIYTNLSSGKTTTVAVKESIIRPSVYVSDLQGLIDQADSFVPTTTLEIYYDRESWTADVKTLSGWVGADKNAGQTKLAWNISRIADYLNKQIAPELDREAQTAKIEMENGRARVFQGAIDGWTLNASSSAEIIAKALAAGETKAELAVEVKPADSGGLDEMLSGIKEIVGVGTSNFAGSPPNRIHNIKTGAAAINGLIIKPGETFSLLKALGPINGQTGYLTELVIKENRTVPEYGGGLCQIGTTMFRTAIDAGLPIAERRNHSYRVVYYEPAGTDATIYDPAPDMKFTNDTSNNLLLNTSVKGTTVRFELWGTKDGREVVYTKPTIYNIVKPGETKLVESPDLKPGQKKCVETAHNGADAYFDYAVTYPSGEKKERRFTSHYIPWRAVCLVGASSTPPITSNTNPSPANATTTPAQ